MEKLPRHTVMMTQGQQVVAVDLRRGAGVLRSVDDRFPVRDIRFPAPEGDPLRPAYHRAGRPSVRSVTRHLELDVLVRRFGEVHRRADEPRGHRDEQLRLVGAAGKDR
jgi:hypothetical protein